LNGIEAILAAKPIPHFSSLCSKIEGVVSRWEEVGSKAMAPVQKTRGKEMSKRIRVFVDIFITKHL